MFRMSCAAGAAVLLASLSVPATEPLVYGYRTGWPLVSPPGWYGPGPAGPHSGRTSPVYSDWQYTGLTGGPGVNAGFGYRGYGGFGPRYFGVPGAAGSYWTNGPSLYGPPIPTYAPVPGTFGNADVSREFFNAPPPANGAVVGVHFPPRNAAGGGALQPPLGWAGQYAPSPRHRPLTVSVHPPSVEVQPGPPAVGPDGRGCCRLTVCVPDPAAQVWVQKTEMTARGVERAFESPVLAGGTRYEYEVIAKWAVNGWAKAETRVVSLTAGQTARVDFTRPADGQ